VQVIDELRNDFVERNTALFMLLGIVSLSDRLTRTVAQPPFVTPQPAKTFDYFTLGLLALAERINGMASRFAEGVPEGAAPAERGDDGDLDLLR
jgi:hypothetical protein